MQNVRSLLTKSAELGIVIVNSAENEGTPVLTKIDVVNAKLPYNWNAILASVVPWELHSVQGIALYGSRNPAATSSPISESDYDLLLISDGRIDLEKHWTRIDGSMVYSDNVEISKLPKAFVADVTTNYNLRHSTILGNVQIPSLPLAKVGLDGVLVTLEWYLDLAAKYAAAKLYWASIRNGLGGLRVAEMALNSLGDNDALADWLAVSKKYEVPINLITTVRKNDKHALTEEERISYAGMVLKIGSRQLEDLKTRMQKYPANESDALWRTKQ